MNNERELWQVNVVGRRNHQGYRDRGAKCSSLQIAISLNEYFFCYNVR